MIAERRVGDETVFHNILFFFFNQLDLTTLRELGGTKGGDEAQG